MDRAGTRRCRQGGYRTDYKGGWEMKVIDLLAIIGAIVFVIMVVGGVTTGVWGVPRIIQCETKWHEDSLTCG